MVNTHAEAEFLHLIHIGDISVYALRHKSASLAICGIYLLELARVIFAMDPLADVVVEILRRPFRQLCGIEELNTDEQVLNVCRFVAIHVEFPEIEIIQDFLESPHTLLKDLFSVRDKEKAGQGMPLLESLVVKGSDHSFSVARKCQGADEQPSR